jgi:hypothetical protein
MDRQCTCFLWSRPRGNIRINDSGSRRRLVEYLHRSPASRRRRRKGPPLPQEDSWYSFLLRDRVDPWAIVRLEGLGQLKNPMTSSGIKPATFRLVACLNQLCYRVPPSLGEGYLMMLLVARVYGSEEDWKMNRNGFGRKWPWQFVCRVRILDVPATIWTQRLQNTSRGRYRYVNMLCSGRQLSETYNKDSLWWSQDFLYLETRAVGKEVGVGLVKKWNRRRRRGCLHMTPTPGFDIRYY